MYMHVRLTRRTEPRSKSYAMHAESLKDDRERRYFRGGPRLRRQDTDASRQSSRERGPACGKMAKKRPRERESEKEGETEKERSGSMEEVASSRNDIRLL